MKMPRLTCLPFLLVQTMLAWGILVAVCVVLLRAEPADADADTGG